MGSSVILSLLLVSLVKVEARLDTYAIQQCATPNDLDQEDDKPSCSNIYILDGSSSVITCEGQIAEWEISSKTTGVIFLDVWRPDRPKVLQYVGSNRINVETVGRAEYEVPIAQRILVEPGDLLGFHFDSYAGDNYVIPMTKSDKESSKLDKVIRFHGDSSTDLKKNVSLDHVPDLYATAGFKAKIHGYNQNLRLEGEGLVREGRAESKSEDTWGTICDNWFEERGWPLLFCYELGYPDVEEACYMNKSGLEGFRAPDNASIHWHSPRCKPSNEGRMVTCDIHPNGTCTHKEDVYIRCNPRVRFGKGDKEKGGDKEKEGKEEKGKKKEGVANFYRDGTWGTVCDSRRVSELEELGEEGWPHAFCVDLGYSAVKAIGKAKDEIKGYNPDEEVTLSEPRCSVGQDTLVNLLQCPPVSQHKPCDHEDDIYIKCK